MGAAHPALCLNKHVSSTVKPALFCGCLENTDLKNEEHRPQKLRRTGFRISVFGITKLLVRWVLGLCDHWICGEV